MNSSDIKIFRSDLITMCDKFLSDEIGINEIQVYADNLLFSDHHTWNDDKVIFDILFCWDNDTINYPINKKNMQLWKEFLVRNKSELEEYNNWKVHIEPQKLICEKYDSKWNPINKKLMVGISSNLLSDPINGLRHPAGKGTTGWFIWTGEYNDNEDFFQPICAEHLLQIRPQIIKYLGLDVGFRFIFDKNDYEDVWFDTNITHINSL